MQDISDILSPGRTVFGAPGISKKRLFDTVAKIISEDQPALDYDDIFNHLVAREKLGSTGLGGGIAIPHCRAGSCPQPLGTLVTLADPIDFDAPDGQPVDLLFVLLVPEEAHQEHLDILAQLARLFSRREFCQSLRGAGDSPSLFRLATSHQI